MIFEPQQPTTNNLSHEWMRIQNSRAVGAEAQSHSNVIVTDSASYLIAMPKDPPPCDLNIRKFCKIIKVRNTQINENQQSDSNSPSLEPNTACVTFYQSPFYMISEYIHSFQPIPRDFLVKFY